MRDVVHFSFLAVVTICERRISGSGLSYVNHPVSRFFDSISETNKLVSSDVLQDASPPTTTPRAAGERPRATSDASWSTTRFSIEFGVAPSSEKSTGGSGLSTRNHRTAANTASAHHKIQVF